VIRQVHNTAVLATVSRNELIHSVYDRQLCFLGHTLRGTYSPHARTYALYQPTHGSTRRGRPRTNYTDYVQKLTGLKINELVESSEARETWLELVVACINPQPPDYRLERFTTNFRLNWQRFVQGHQALVFTSPGMCS